MEVMTDLARRNGAGCRPRSRSPESSRAPVTAAGPLSAAPSNRHPDGERMLPRCRRRRRPPPPRDRAPAASLQSRPESTWRTRSPAPARCWPCWESAGPPARAARPLVVLHPDWATNFGDIFGASTVPSPARSTCGSRRDHRGVAPEGCENLLCWCPSRRRRIGGAATRGTDLQRWSRPSTRRSTRSRPGRRSRICASASVCGTRWGGRLRHRLPRLAWRRTRPRAHLAAERVPQAGEHLQDGRRTPVRRGQHRRRGWLADVPDQRRVGAQATDRRPFDLAGEHMSSLEHWAYVAMLVACLVGTLPSIPFSV